MTVAWFGPISAARVRHHTGAHPERDFLRRVVRQSVRWSISRHGTG
jgi:hypothetical protein